AKHKLAVLGQCGRLLCDHRVADDLIHRLARQRRLALGRPAHARTPPSGDARSVATAGAGRSGPSELASTVAAVSGACLAFPFSRCFSASTPAVVIASMSWFRMSYTFTPIVGSTSMPGMLRLARKNLASTVASTISADFQPSAFSFFASSPV